LLEYYIIIVANKYFYGGVLTNIKAYLGILP